MHTTLYQLHSAHTEAALTGHRHYAAALRVMLAKQIASLRPDLGRGAVLGLPEQQKATTGQETCPVCHGDDYPVRRGMFCGAEVQWRECFDCGHQGEPS